MQTEITAVDKIRFVDAEAVFRDTKFQEETGGPFVYRFEVSDERSSNHHVTFFICMGVSHPFVEKLVGTERFKTFPPHNPKVYHKEKFADPKDPMLDATHFHWLFDAQPSRSDVEEVLTSLDSAVAPAFKEYILDYWTV